METTGTRRGTAIRIVLATIAFIVLVVASLGVSTYADWRAGPASSVFLAAPPPAVDTTGLDAQRDIDARTTTLALSVGPQITADRTVTTPGTDPLLLAAIEGNYATNPGKFAAFFGDVILSGTGQAGIAWEPPTVDRPAGATEGVIRQHGHAERNTKLATTLWIDLWSPVLSPVAATVTTTESGLRIISFYPETSAASISPTSAKTIDLATTTTDNQVFVTVEVNSDGAPETTPAEYTRPAAVTFLELLLGALWTLAPWVLLVFLLRRRLRNGSEPSGATSATGGAAWFLRRGSMLVWMALATGVLTAVNQLDFTLLDLSKGAEDSPLQYLLQYGITVPAFVTPLILVAACAMEYAGPVKAHSRIRTIVAGIVLAFAVTAILLLPILRATPDQTAALAFTLLFVGAGVAFVLAAVRRPSFPTLVFAVVPPLILAMARSTIDSVVASSVEDAVTYAISLGILAAAFLYVFRATRHEDGTSALPGWAGWFVALVLGVLLWPKTWAFFGYSSLTSWAGPLLQVLSFALLAVLLASLGSHYSWTKNTARLTCLVAVVVLMFRTDLLYLGVPVSALIGIVLVLGVLLVAEPDVESDSAQFTLDPDPEVVVGGTRRLLIAANGARLDREMAGAFRKKLTSGGTDPADVPTIQGLVRSTQSGARTRPVLRSSGLGWGGTGTPVQRGLFGAAVAFFVTLPFSIPLIAPIVDSITNPGAGSRFAAVVTPLVAFRFPLYGFAFGFFFPMLRGNGGVEKCLRLLVVLGASETAAVLLPFASGDVAGLLALRGVQLAVLCVSLGLAFDYRSLLKAGYGIDQFGDLYNRNRLTLWSSGIALTLVSVLLTTVLSTGTAALITRLTPPNAPQQQTNQSTK